MYKVNEKIEDKLFKDIYIVVTKAISKGVSVKILKERIECIINELGSR